MGGTFRTLHRAHTMFIFAYVMAACVNAMLIPDVQHLQFYFVFGPSLAMALALGLHTKQSLGGAHETDPPESIAPDRFSPILERWINALAGGDFSPDQFPWRSALEALLVLFQLFAPCYVTLRWFAGDPLPAVVSWSGVGARFILTFVMLILFVCIRKACKLAVGI